MVDADFDYRASDPNYTFSRGIYRRNRSSDCSFSPLQVLAEIHLASVPSGSRVRHTRSMPFAALHACAGQIPRRQRR